MEPPIEHREVTTNMGRIGDIQADVHEVRLLLEEDDGEEEARKMTAEEKALREEHQRMARERIAYHEAKAKEQEEAAARGRGE